MTVAETLQSRVRANPRTVTAGLSAVGYALVAGAFTGLAPFPEVSRGTVILLGDAIAVVNTLALLVILAGVRFIRRGDVSRHRAAMLTAFALIVLFLVLYLVKVGGGFEKAIRAEGIVLYAYLAMLAVHIVLAVVSIRKGYSLERLWAFDVFLVLFTVLLLSVLRSIVGIGFFHRTLQVDPATSIVYVTVLEIGLFVVALGVAYSLAYRGGYSRLRTRFTT
jgi:putative membrane protein